MQYKVLTPLDHNRQNYAPGQMVELDEATAARLIEGGTVRDPNAPADDKGLDLSRRVYNAKNGIEPEAPAPAAVVSTDAPVADEDTTPGPDNKPSVSEAMSRSELEQIALAEGATQEMVDACKNKAEVVSLIEANRKPADADPSADL